MKKNHQGLYEQLRSLPWGEATAKCSTTGPPATNAWRPVGVRALTVTDLGVDFPRAAQVAKIKRYRTSARTGKRTRESVYVITGPSSRQASPERIAKIVRSQWVIENRLHFVRDTTFREDASQVRAGSRPENMATFCGFAINQLRAAGHTNIAAGVRPRGAQVRARGGIIVRPHSSSKQTQPPRSAAVFPPAATPRS